MSDGINQGSELGMHASAAVGAANGIQAGIGLHNTYKFVLRGPVQGPDGRWRRKCKSVWEVPNRVVTEGLNDILTKYFKGSSYTATWFVGLIDNSGFTALAATDTAAKITTTANPPTTNGWQEVTAYSESVRQTLTLGTAASGSIDNTAAKAVFSINATKTVYGAFVDSNSTKGGTSGVLYGEAAFASPRALVSGDTLTVSVTLTAATA